MNKGAMIREIWTAQILQAISNDKTLTLDEAMIARDGVERSMEKFSDEFLERYAGHILEKKRLF